jgi:bifunctional UDP-N-acetylglucosamine pyrophosphorylase/glucosamine-1-phosphate N-acetyltransferase
MKITYSILAAGKGTRMGSLTKETNKCLLNYKGKPILGHILDSLISYTSEISVVVNYKKDAIIDYCKKSYPNIKFNFIEQKKLNGTADAISYLQNDSKFYFITMGDTIYSEESISNFISEFRKNKQNLILVDTVKNPEKYGVIYEKNNIIEKIIEKPKNPKSKIVNLGTYILEKSIFSYIKNTKKSNSGEVYITDTFQNMIDDGKKFYIHKINKEYKDLTYESDLNQ